MEIFTKRLERKKSNIEDKKKKKLIKHDFLFNKSNIYKSSLFLKKIRIFIATIELFVGLHICACSETREWSLHGPPMLKMVPLSFGKQTNKLRKICIHHTCDWER
jgi:hypothetical protein